MDTPPTAAQREEIRQRFLQVDTSTVADVLDVMGLPDQGLAPGFAPYPATAGKLAGWAYTIRGQMTPGPLGGDPGKMEACHGVTPGSISVWAGDGEGICYFGELIALGMQERGCMGALVDGGIRDIAAIGRRGFPVYARYRTPIQSIGRWKVTGHQVPVTLRGATVKRVRVEPGDFILGDEDGLLAVPHAVAAKVLADAEALTRTEMRIRADLEGGATLADTLRKYGHV